MNDALQPMTHKHTKNSECWCDVFFLLVGFSLSALLKYLGRSLPSASPAVSNTPFSDQKNSIPSVESDTHMETRVRH